MSEEFVEERVWRNPPRMSDAAYAEKMEERRLTPDGVSEMPDPTPVAPPIGYKRQPSMVDHIREMVRRELSARAEEAGLETFEESDDFDVPDDMEPASAYEMAPDYEPVGSFRARKEVEEAEAKLAAERQAAEVDRQGPPEAARETLDGPSPEQASPRPAPRAGPPKPS